MTRKIDEAAFVQTVAAHGVAKGAAALGLDPRGANRRRRRIEQREGVAILREVRAKARLHVAIEDGVVLIGSDAHYWPGPATTAHRAFVQFAERLRPKAVILNGDVIDASTISRHPPIGWENAPTVAEEIAAAQERTEEIKDAAHGARLLWTEGNHDARFETRLATVAPEYAEVNGIHLKDHFPDWEPCWSVWLGGERGAVVKHRFKGGIHATFNNALYSGRTVVTAHQHSLRVTPFTDYNGTRWGVDDGCLADPYAQAFEGYTEDNPVNWRSGFVVLTWVAGRLLQPELVMVVEDGIVDFRGEIIPVA